MRRNLDPPQQSDNHPSTPEPPSPPALRVRPMRSRRQPLRYGEYGRTAVVHCKQDPATYKKAMKSFNWEASRRAAVSEFESLVGKNTWRLVPCPARRHIIRCKWVFKTKLNVDKSIDKLKARLVALGFLR